MSECGDGSDLTSQSAVPATDEQRELIALWKSLRTDDRLVPLINTFRASGDPRHLPYTSIVEWLPENGEFLVSFCGSALNRGLDRSLGRDPTGMLLSELGDYGKLVADASEICRAKEGPVSFRFDQPPKGLPDVRVPFGVTVLPLSNNGSDICWFLARVVQL